MAVRMLEKKSAAWS